jgi:acylphosphatase
VGAVKITLQGHDLKAEAFIAQLKKSNTRLQIENFEVTEKDLPSFSTFSIIED